jgi:hypothetical protein
MVSIIILYYNTIIIWDHCHICGPSLTETSLCDAWLYHELHASKLNQSPWNWKRLHYMWSGWKRNCCSCSVFNSFYLRSVLNSFIYLYWKSPTRNRNLDVTLGWPCYGFDRVSYFIRPWTAHVTALSLLQFSQQMAEQSLSAYAVAWRW